jgi:hypothetical protein
LARGQCLEHDGRERRETQAALDEADGQAEAARNILDSRTACHECCEAWASAGFMARRWKFSARLSTAASALSSSTRHFVITREDLVVRERQHRAAATLAGFDLELALCGRPDDEVCSSLMGDAGLKLTICCRIATTNIAGRLNEFVQRDRLDHGTHS